MPLATMSQARCSIGAVAVGRFIIACGVLSSVQGEISTNLQVVTTAARVYVHVSATTH